MPPVRPPAPVPLCAILLRTQLHGGEPDGEGPRNPDLEKAWNAMKKFRFPLDKLLRYRRSRLAERQAELEKLLAGRAQVERCLAALEQEEQLVMDSLRRMPVLGADDLASADQFRRYAVAESARLLREVSEFASRIEAARQAVVDARREVEILERLRERRLNAWRQEVDRETEQQIAELVVARWRRSQQAG